MKQETVASVYFNEVMHQTQRIKSASVIVLVLLIITVVDLLRPVHVSNLHNLDAILH